MTPTPFTATHYHITGGRRVLVQVLHDATYRVGIINKTAAICYRDAKSPIPTVRSAGEFKAMFHPLPPSTHKHD
jgi:hypothetical protein